MLTAGGPNSECVMNVEIIVDDSTTKEEVGRLADVLSNYGREPFVTTFVGTKKRVVGFMGSRGFNIIVDAAQSIPTEKGRKVLLFREREVWGANTHEISTRGGYLFMVIELDLDGTGKGTGKIFHQANIQFNKDATLSLEA
jgi:hypothetical protein